MPTGVPAMIGAQMILKGLWERAFGVWNMEQRDPDPFMEELNLQGLPWQIVDLPLQNRAATPPLRTFSNNVEVNTRF